MNWCCPVHNLLLLAGVDNVANISELYLVRQLNGDRVAIRIVHSIIVGDN